LRGQEGTSAVAWVDGDRINLAAPDTVFDRVYETLMLDGSNVMTGDIAWSDTSQPRISLDSIGTGDAWTAQGALISLGESANQDNQPAAVRLAYNGSGTGYVGMGVVDASGVTAAGIPSRGHLRFQSATEDVWVYRGASIAQLWKDDGDIAFYKDDGSTTSLLWDESDDQWEFYTNVWISSNLWVGGGQILTTDANIQIQAKMSGAAAANIQLFADDSGGVQRVRLLVDGDGHNSFYDNTGDLQLQMGTSSTIHYRPVTFSDGAYFAGTAYINDPADPTAGTQVGDRDYNDTRYALSSGGPYLPLAGGTVTGVTNFNGVNPLVINSAADASYREFQFNRGTNQFIFTTDGSYSHWVNKVSTVENARIRLGATGVRLSVGANKVRAQLGVNDISFYKADGTTVSLLWDESDDRWEFGTDIVAQGKSILGLVNVSGGNGQFWQFSGPCIPQAGRLHYQPSLG